MMKHTKLRCIGKGIVCLVFAVMLAVTGITTAPVTAQAAETFVYEDSDMIGQGGYIYFIRRQYDTSTATICRKKVSDGKVSKVVTEPNGIMRLVVSGQYLYYTTVDDGTGWVIRMCQLDGDDVRTLCEGTVSYADAQHVYGIEVLASGKQRLFCMEYETEDVTRIKTVKAKQSLEYVTNIGSDSYYSLYDQKTDKISLYRLNTSKNQLVRVATDKRSDNESASPLCISDVAQSGGELYYNFGSYEGSGNYWYGTICKLTVDGKKKTVTKDTADDTLMLGSRELYFSTPQGNNYKYQLSTGKKSKYSLTLQKDVTYTILGDKTYMADTSNAKKIEISRFKSGTDRETLTKNFISISFKQKKNVSYTVSIRQVGIYNLVCVTGTDFTDQTYGWRGKLTGINWYITDGAGTVLGSFK